MASMTKAGDGAPHNNASCFSIFRYGIWYKHTMLPAPSNRDPLVAPPIHGYMSTCPSRVRRRLPPQEHHADLSGERLREISRMPLSKLHLPFKPQVGILLFCCTMLAYALL
jgi:hypothetical protein